MAKRARTEHVHAALIHNRSRDYAEDEHPLCFADRAEYDGWLEHQRLANQKGKVARPYPFDHIPNFCRDCAPARKRQMQRESRCEFPSVRFFPGQRNGSNADDIEPCVGRMVFPGQQRDYRSKRTKVTD